MKDYYEFIIGVYVNDTQFFFNSIKFELNKIILQKNNRERNKILRRIKSDLLLVYGIKVEGVDNTPSRIIELLNIINALLNNE